jgi:hypothetical protein
MNKLTPQFKTQRTALDRIFRLAAIPKYEQVAIATANSEHCAFPDVALLTHASDHYGLPGRICTT